MRLNGPMEQRLADVFRSGANTIPHTIDVALETLDSGWFLKISRELDLPWRYIANCLDVEGPVLRKWVRGEVRPNRISSLKITIFRQEVDAVVGSLEPGYLDVALPVKALAMLRSTPTSHLLRDCAEGRLDCRDLGVLGMWAPASDAERESYAKARRRQIERERTSP